MSIRLYVGNLPAEVDRQALETVFNDSGEAVSLKVITDRKTGKCRGFAFITVGNEELADSVIDKFNGYDFNGAVLKLEKALPRAKGEKGDDGQDDNFDHSNEHPGHETGDLNGNQGDPSLSEGGEPAPQSESSKFSARLSKEPNGVDQRDPKSGGKRNNKSKRGGSNNRSAQVVPSSTEPHQPDPRWAQELEQLKQRLMEAQTAK
jgi:RNA recognition motif-containing protein